MLNVFVVPLCRSRYVEYLLNAITKYAECNIVLNAEYYKHLQHMNENTEIFPSELLCWLETSKTPLVVCEVLTWLHNGLSLYQGGT